MLEIKVKNYIYQFFYIVFMLENNIIFYGKIEVFFFYQDFIYIFYCLQVLKYICYLNKKLKMY